MTNEVFYPAGFAIALVIAIAGYVEARMYPNAPGIACVTWIWALSILTAGLAIAPILGSFKLVLAAGVFIGGSILVARYYKVHRNREAN
jgi:hypothetical protein